MRQSFSFDRSQARARRRLFFVTLLIILIFIIDSLTGGGLRSLARSTASRLWIASEHVRGAIFGSGYFVTHGSLARENAALRDALAKAQEDAASYAALKAENDELRAFLHVPGASAGITAPIVSSTFSSPYGTFLVGAGKDTISIGDVALTSDGFAIATITKTGTRTSTASEVFAPGATVRVIIGKTAAEAEGRGGGNARATLARGVAIKIGDVVTAPELGGRPIGIVGKVDSPAASAEQTIYIGLPIDLSSLKFVYLAH